MHVLQNGQIVERLNEDLHDKDNENDKQNDVKSQICRIINICYSIKIKSKEGNEQTNINDSLNVFIVDTFSGLCVCSCVFVCVCE